MSAVEVYRAYPWLLELFVGVFGALVGSFLNVVIARLPVGESIVSPRSHCPHCGDMIPAYLNIPVLSWLALRGRCRNCKRPISIRYPMVELITATLFYAAARRFGLTPPLLPALAMIGALVAITFIDLDHFIIPDEISLPGILIAVIARPLVFPVPWYSGLFGAAMGAGFLWFIRWIFFKLRGIEGMGMGDVKLLAMLGGFLGVGMLLPLILIASISGTILGGLSLLLSLKDEAAGELAPEPSEPAVSEPPAEVEAPASEPAPDEEEEDWEPPPGAVPFGPFLAIGGLTMLLMGPAVMQWVRRFLY